MAYRGRDSFDRFGDDMCEQILSYLPLSDCFEYQFVSKQFKALVFNKQNKLILIGDQCWNTSHEKSAIVRLVKSSRCQRNLMLEYMLKKCVNITNLIIDVFQMKITDDIITIVSDNCKHLKHLTFNASIHYIKLECMQEFGDKCLKNVESIKFLKLFNRKGDELLVNTLIPFMPKLKSFDCKKRTERFLDNNLNDITKYWKSLETVKTYEIIDHQFITFANNFSEQLKCLRVRINKKLNMDLMKHLSRFERLECLDCDFFSDKGIYNYNELLKLVGTKCVQLKVLQISYLRTPFYDAFGDGFQSLEKLIINCCERRCENISLLKSCANLKHLVFKGGDAKQSNFKDIAVYLPQLTSIDIHSRNDTKFRRILQHLEKLPNLYELKFGKLNDVNTADILLFLERCVSVRKLGIHCHPFRALKNVDQTIIHDFIQTNNRKLILYLIK